MSDGTESVFVRDLERFVKNEASIWGDKAADGYFTSAEAQTGLQWEWVQSFLSPHPVDYTTTLELSCGHGRNSEILASLAQNMILVDVNPENIAFCKRRFEDKQWHFIVNNGFDLRDVASGSITFVHCFEAAVHMDLEIILSYIKEFRRILTPGGFGFVHHSNVTAYPGADIRKVYGWRTFMSKAIFAHLCIHNGLEIIDQHIFDQGGPGADCLSLLRKPATTMVQHGNLSKQPENAAEQLMELCMRRGIDWVLDAAWQRIASNPQIELYQPPRATPARK
jgi:SAM-dependent methyltransferase